MSKGSKGGSTGSTKVQVPSGIGQNSVSLSQLGAYGAGYLPALTSMANWASYIATGGNTTQANPFNAIGGGNAGLANQTVGYTQNLGATLGQESPTFSNTGGYNPPSVTGITNVGSSAFGGSGGTGVIGSGGSATASGGTNAQGGMFPATPQVIPGTNNGVMGFMGNSFTSGGVSYTPVYDQNTQQLIGTVNNSTGKYNPGSIEPGLAPQMYQGQGGGVSMPAQQAPASTGGSSGSILGPFLQNAWDAIQAEGAGANQLGGEGTQLFNEGQSLIGPANATIAEGESILGQGQGMVNQATSGTGLYPSQQALVNQTVQSQQAAIQQQMASEGLTSSTQNAQLQGQAAQQGAATAGALIQGNIAAGQAQEGIGQAQIGLGDQQLSLAENWSQLGVATQQAAISAITTMASQSAGLQSQAWNQAMQGYGMIGQFLQASMAGFGESNTGLGMELQASETQAQLNAGIAQQQAAASSQGMSSLLGSVGQLLGGSGGSGGGLIGSLGGLLGGGGGAAVGAAGAAGATALGAAGGLGAVAGAGAGASAGISAAATAIGAALSCIVAREVYGSFDGTWMRFREWMMFDAPDPVRMFYVKHAHGVAQWLKANPDWKPFFKFYMDAILE